MAIEERYAAGHSVLELLPVELLQKILFAASLNADSVPLDCVARSLQDVEGGNQKDKAAGRAGLLPCLLTSRTLYTSALLIMYRQVSISCAANLSHLRLQLERSPTLGRFLRSLDLSSMDVHDTADEVASNLEACIDRTPLLQHLLIPPQLSNHLPSRLFEKLFTSLPYLTSLSLESCSTPSLSSALSTLLEPPPSSSSPLIIPPSTKLKLLNLSHCTLLPPSLFISLLPHLRELQVLNLEETQITSSALSKIPRGARITHLNLNSCALLEDDEEEWFRILRTHPAFASSIESLEIAHTTHLTPHLPSSEQKLSQLLTSLSPIHLRVLDLSGHRMSKSHIAPLTKLSRLEILRLGTGLTMDDVEALFFSPDVLHHIPNLPSSSQFTPSGSGSGSGPDKQENPSLTTLRHAILSCKLKSRIRSIAPSPVRGIKILDLSSLEGAEQGRILGSCILGVRGLKMLVLGGEVYERLAGRGGKGRRVLGEVGWSVEWPRGDGKRCWIVRH